MTAKKYNNINKPKEKKSRLFQDKQSVNDFSQQNKAKINAISTLSNIITELYHAAHCRLHVVSAGCVARDLHTDCAWGHLSICVGDSLRHSEEL